MVARGPRHLRRRDVLRRRDDHAGDLGAGRGGGARDHCPDAAPVHRPRQPGDHPRAVRDPEAGHRERRHPLRSSDVHMVHGNRAAGADRDRPQSRRAARAQSVLRDLVRRIDAANRLSHAGSGRARGHGDRGALRRHGSLRRLADSPRMAAVRDALARAQLFRTGRAAARRPRRDQEPVLPAGAAMGAHSTRDPRDLRGGDRIAGGHFRRVLADARGDPDGLLSAAQAAAHVRAADRSDLCPLHQLDVAGGGGAAGAGVPELRQPGRRLRHRGDARDDDRLRADLRRHAADLGLGAAPRRSRSRCRFARSTSPFWRRTR